MADFLSYLLYNQCDQSTPARLAGKLADAGIRVWFDQSALESGLDGANQSIIGLNNSATGAVLIGQHGLGDWERPDLKLAIERAARDRTLQLFAGERAFRLFVVRLPGSPEPLSSQTLPPFLRTCPIVDLRQGFDAPDALQPLIDIIQTKPADASLNPVSPDESSVELVLPEAQTQEVAPPLAPIANIW